MSSVAICPQPCKNGKKQFASQREADEYAREWYLAHPGTDVQYSYPCPDCRFFHLSAKAVGFDRVSQTGKILRRAAITGRRGYRHMPDSEVIRLSEAGMSCGEIAIALDELYPSVYQCMRRLGLITRRKHTGGLTLQLIRGRMRTLQAEIERLKVEEARLCDLLADRMPSAH